MIELIGRLLILLAPIYVKLVPSTRLSAAILTEEVKPQPLFPYY